MRNTEALDITGCEIVTCDVNRKVARDGDHRAFDAFFATATPIVFGYAVRLCGGDRERAADLTQEAWLAMVADLNRGSNRAPSVGWLIAVARSRFIDDLRRQQKLPAKLAMIWSAERGSAPELTITDLIDQLDPLEPLERAVVLMSVVDDLTVPEIAHELGVSRSTAYAILSRARTALRAPTVGGAHA